MTCPRRGDPAIAARLLILAVALLLPPTAGTAAELYGQVIAITDGDSLTLLVGSRTQLKIRLAGIDAPELRQPYGTRSKQHLAALAHGRSARVSSTKRDRWGRTVGRVLINECERPDCPHTVDVALEQLRAGLAWHYRQYEREQAPGERASYAAVEAAARARRQGLWRDSAPVAPWAYRRRTGRDTAASVVGA
jgi:endonuclease YncB( thermonuclease family)